VNIDRDLTSKSTVAGRAGHEGVCSTYDIRDNLLSSCSEDLKSINFVRRAILYTI
jgi:hypothetical protein